MMTFETEQDIIRERKAIDAFVKTFSGSYKKLDEHDVDYKLFDSNGKHIAYVEVKGRIRTMHNAYPLPIAARKLVKLMDKRITGIVIWCCEDGIIYGRVDKLKGDIKWGGRPPRDNSLHDEELMVYYEKQSGLKYLRF